MLQEVQKPSSEFATASQANRLARAVQGHDLSDDVTRSCTASTAEARTVAEQAVSTVKQGPRRDKV